MSRDTTIFFKSQRAQSVEVDSVSIRNRELM
jgi:hypothetical protein